MDMVFSPLTNGPKTSPAKNEIWYMNQLGWKRCGGICGERPELPTLDSTHILLGTTDEDDLDVIFNMMQGENWSPRGEAYGVIQGKGLRHTSMSIGDVVVKKDGSAFVVAPLGFDQFSTPREPDLWTCPDCGAGVDDYGCIRRCCGPIN